MSRTKNRFSPEVRERAARLEPDGEEARAIGSSGTPNGQHGSRWQAVLSISAKIGCAPQTLSDWVNKAEVDSGKRAGVSSEMAGKTMRVPYWPTPVVDSLTVRAAHKRAFRKMTLRGKTALITGTAGAIGAAVGGCILTKRFGMVIGLKAKRVADCKRLRAAVWPRVLDKLRALPGLRFVIVHIAKPEIAKNRLDARAEPVRRLGTRRQIWGKLPRMVTDADWATSTPAPIAPHFAEVSRISGPSRCTTGTDWLVSLLAAVHQRTVGLVRDAIATLNKAGQRAVLWDAASDAYFMREGRL